MNEISRQFDQIIQSHPREAVDAMSFYTAEMERRDAAGRSEPRLVVVLDELAERHERHAEAAAQKRAAFERLVGDLGIGNDSQVVIVSVVPSYSGDLRIMGNKDFQTKDIVLLRQANESIIRMADGTDDKT